MPKLIRVTTVPMALRFLLPGQMRFMKDHGFEVTMISADGPERAQVILDEGCPHVIVPMTRKITPVADLVSLLRLYRLFRKERPDIVHSHTPKAGLLAMLAAKMARVPLRIHTVAGLRFMTSSGLTRKVLEKMERVTAYAATNIWPNSQSLLGYLTRENLVPPAKLELIGYGSSNGIDLRRFNDSAIDPSALAEAKQLIRYDPSCFYIVTVGRIVADKGISELVQAFASVSRDHPSVRLVLVGDQEPGLDPLDAETQQTIKGHPGIISTGWRNDVEYFMKMSDLLIHPSHREGFPNVLLQAGAMGCPVLCSRITGNIDIVEDAITGIIFEVNDETDLELKLRFALDQPDLVRSCAANLSAKVRQYFERSAVHLAILEKYNSLLNDHK